VTRHNKTTLFGDFLSHSLNQTFITYQITKIQK
jgi:hypothetical protein